MSNPITPTVVQTLLITDTGASALVVGGALGATVGTGTVKAGTLNDSVGTLATVRAGGIGIASQATGDFIFASSATQLDRLAAGGALQYIRRNAANNAYEFGVPPMALVGAASGTNTTAAATNVATFAISGLTVLDTLKVIVRHSSITQATAEPVIYNSTDSVNLFTNTNAGATIAGTPVFGGCSVEIGCDPALNTLIGSQALVMTAAVSGTISNTSVAYTQTATATTDWTGSWTLALRTGAGGVTAGGTYRYRISVYRIPGQ